ncbi:MAG: hypothetical protein HN368_13410 [Spirochaetales bacterium]|jgi:hypothetical protein|nr:hypothetical protein [Spirochaetales bacterium]
MSSTIPFANQPKNLSKCQIPPVLYLQAGISCATGLEYKEKAFAVWPGNGNVAEKIGNGKSNIREGDLDYDKGEFGKAFSFGETSGEIASFFEAVTVTQELTLEAWVMHEYLGDDIQCYVTTGGEGPGGEGDDCRISLR